jgi:hypothetical protein
MRPTRALYRGRFLSRTLGCAPYPCSRAASMTESDSYCTQVGSASSDELEAVLQELLSAIHEKIERLRGLATGQLLGGAPPKERRTLRP